MSGDRLMTVELHLMAGGNLEKMKEYFQDLKQDTPFKALNAKVELPAVNTFEGVLKTYNAKGLKGLIFTVSFEAADPSKYRITITSKTTSSLSAYTDEGVVEASKQKPAPQAAPAAGGLEPKPPIEKVGEKGPEPKATAPVGPSAEVIAALSALLNSLRTTGAADHFLSKCTDSNYVIPTNFAGFLKIKKLKLSNGEMTNLLQPDGTVSPAIKEIVLEKGGIRAEFLPKIEPETVETTATSGGLVDPAGLAESAAPTGQIVSLENILDIQKSSPAQITLVFLKCSQSPDKFQANPKWTAAWTQLLPSLKQQGLAGENDEVPEDLKNLMASNFVIQGGKVVQKSLEAPKPAARPAAKPAATLSDPKAPLADIIADLWKNAPWFMEQFEKDWIQFKKNNDGPWPKGG
jgi:hypothetical protein